MLKRTQRGSPGLALLALLGLAGLLWSTEARAQRGIDVDTFRPALDGYGLFAIERAETSPQWDFGFKLSLDYAHQPLRLALRSMSGQQTASKTVITNWQAVAHLGAHVGLT